MCHEQAEPKQARRQQQGADEQAPKKKRKIMRCFRWVFPCVFAA